MRHAVGNAVTPVAGSPHLQFRDFRVAQVCGLEAKLSTVENIIAGLSVLSDKYSQTTIGRVSQSLLKRYNEVFRALGGR